MSVLSKEIVDAFWAWYRTDTHEEYENYCAGQITKAGLEAMKKKEFIDFFFQFARDGGKIQSGGQRTAPLFRQTLEQNYAAARKFLMEPFDAGFDEARWLKRSGSFKAFGPGIMTIYLNRLDSGRYAILNEKSYKAMRLLGFEIPRGKIGRYLPVRNAELKILEEHPEFRNLYVVDALTHFLIGTKEGQTFLPFLGGHHGVEPTYWVYAPGEKALFWEEYRASGIMGVGWDEVAKDLEGLGEEEVRAAYRKASPSGGKSSEKGLVDFVCTLKPGDRIIAKKGIREVVGFGIVESDYKYDSSKPTYRHFRKVKWIKTGSWKATLGGRGLPQKTLTKFEGPRLSSLLSSLGGWPQGEDARTTPAKEEIGSIGGWRNLILYGPPGTGKTYALKVEWMDRFTEACIEPTRETIAADLASRSTWWEAAAIALLDHGASTVQTIAEHPVVKARAEVSSSANVRATLWTSLQEHTKNDCPDVKYGLRLEPLVFWKDEKSLWDVDTERITIEAPHLLEAAASLKQKPTSPRVEKRYEFVTFHQAYSYEDFVEGIKPVMGDDESGALRYEIKNGIFKTLCSRARENTGKDYALLIDEINRGNVASVFGELITLIEEDKREGAPNEIKVRLPYSREEFSVPPNLFIIGTMNTADRSVEALDTALRRRFTFREFSPSPQLLRQPEGFRVDLRRLLETINKRIEMLLDRDHCIGHSYFLPIATASNPLDALRGVFGRKVLPLLHEYFYGNPDRIGMVLGSRFVLSDGQNVTLKASRDNWEVEDVEERRILRFADPAMLSEEDFTSIYE
jgi:hypothetical protein